MSVATQITRINNNIANAYTKLQLKGATIPTNQNSANLPGTIETIQIGVSGDPPNEIDAILAGTYNILTEEVCQSILNGTYEYVPNV